MALKRTSFTFLQGVLWAFAALAAVLSAGCEGTASLAAGLQGELASERAAACIRAGQLREKRVLPLLVECLEDSDADVRLFAITALKKITGQSLEYRYFAPSPERSEAVRRWRKWLQQRKRGDGV